MGFKPTMSFRLRFCRPLPSFTRPHVLLDWSVTIRLSSRYQRDAFPIKLQSNLVPRSGIDPLPSACKTETLPLRHRGIYFVLLERLELSCLSAYAPQTYVSASSTTWAQKLKQKVRAGFEPAHDGFADRPLNHLGTAP